MCAFHWLKQKHMASFLPNEREHEAVEEGWSGGGAGINGTPRQRNAQEGVYASTHKALMSFQISSIWLQIKTFKVQLL